MLAELALRLARHRRPLLSLFLSLYYRMSLTLPLLADDTLRCAGHKASCCLKMSTPDLGGVGGTSHSYLVIASLLGSTAPSFAHFSWNLYLIHCLSALARLRLTTPVPD